jgi:hypothetical protein
MDERDGGLCDAALCLDIHMTMTAHLDHMNTLRQLHSSPIGAFETPLPL